jgi:hypothetical protein
MVPFVLARPSRSAFSTVPSDVLEPSRLRDLAFFAARGIFFERDFETADPARMSVTFKYTTVTKSTETTIPTTDSDEKTYEQVDGNDIDP